MDEALIRDGVLGLRPPTAETILRDLQARMDWWQMRHGHRPKGFLLATDVGDWFIDALSACARNAQPMFGELRFEFGGLPVYVHRQVQPGTIYVLEG